MDLRHILEPALSALGALAPSLIGSAVAQAWKPGLPWRQRILQWVVGSTVSYYATIGVIQLTGWNEFVAQSIAFAIALLAFDATPRVIAAAGDVLADLPARLIDRLFGKGR
ncbi:hypothetical protein SAMN06295912_102242 [Sphingomonas laterariae]|uniref:Holin n=1 Tax=Edaphosphingomonas laterariae TaxID=861865 RepID=A0A239CKI3_9SPHN|nr:hypothetical protein [Sphingomonas laterariae]SNS20181.1 hypothetical protein SAMN06295912_102242 [Sphingomonas laterariae]